MRAFALHEIGNWFILMDCSNAFNAVNSIALLER